MFGAGSVWWWECLVVGAFDAGSVFGAGRECVFGAGSVFSLYESV